jgi:uncharacterized protein
MSQQLVIESLSFALQGRSMTGQIPLQRFVRLLDQVESPDGALSFSLTGQTGDEGEPMLVLHVTGTLPLRCQRCLGTIDFALDVEQAYELRDEADEESLVQEDLEDDSRDFLAASRSLDVVELIEEEALLSLPLVARHERCELPGQAHNPEAASPFGVLRTLVKQSGKTH